MNATVTTDGTNDDGAKNDAETQADIDSSQTITKEETVVATRTGGSQSGYKTGLGLELEE